MSQTQKEKPNNKFVDLLQHSDLTYDEKQYRAAIDTAFPHSATSLSEFVNLWKGMNFDLSAEVHLDGSVKQLGIPGRGETNRHLCQVVLSFCEQEGLKITFSARSSPILYQYDRQDMSPVALYNTKVTAHRIENFNPFIYYDSMMYLMKKVSPPTTRLRLYVRQYESRTMLNNGASPTEIPLTRVFGKAGWTLQDYIFDPKKSELQQHTLLVES